MGKGRRTMRRRRRGRRGRAPFRPGIPAAAITVGALLLGACGDSTGPDPVEEFDVDLGVGESEVVRADGSVLRVHLPAASEGREYRLSVQSASRTSGASTPMRLRTESSGTTSTSLRSKALPRAGAPGLGELTPEERGLGLEARMREAARRELLRRNVRPARRSGAGFESPASVRPVIELPEQGEMREFNYFVDSETLRPDCDDTTTVITAEVKAVGERVAFVEDTAAPSGGFSDLDYQELTDEFDQLVFATDSAYFGETADIDENQVVLALFTPRVNELSDPDGDTFAGGFFTAIDLADSGDSDGGGEPLNGEDCPASNEAELLYLAVPDPNGEFGQEFDTETALNNARRVTSHEFQHLINAEQRVILGTAGFGGLEEVWLNEGLSHLAEEIVGLRFAGQGVRQNLAFEDVASSDPSLEAFNIFQLQNFARLGRYFQNPGQTEALAVEDPGDVETLRLRGFAWLLMRWLGDQDGPAGDGIVPGSREEELFRHLARGGDQHLQGIENVESAVQAVAGGEASWEGLLAEFSAMPAVTDDVGPELEARLELPTWDLRDIFRELNEQLGGDVPAFSEPYPLAVTTTGFGSDVHDFEVNSSTQVYFRFGEEDAVPALTLELTDQAGGALASSAAPQITIVRTQ